MPAPGQPTGLSATPGPASVGLSWTAPASNGGFAITDYVVQYRTTPLSPYSDDFNRADATLTTPWVTTEGTHSVASNKVPVGPSSPNISYYNGTFSNDQWAEADCVGLGGTPTISVAVRASGSAGGDLYYCWTSPSNLSVVKRVGGSYTTLATDSGAGVNSAGAKIAIEVVGTTIKAYIDGTLRITTSDTQVSTGKPGIISANGAGPTLDNFRCGSGAYPGPPAPAFVGSRTFNGSGDNLQWDAAESIGAALWLPGTTAILMNRSRNSAGGDGGGYQVFMGASFGNGQLAGALYWDPDDHFYYYSNGTGGHSSGDPKVQVADGWCLGVVTSSTTNGMNSHLYKYGTTGPWQHFGLWNGTPVTDTLNAGSYFEFSNQNGWNQWLAGDVAVVAYWNRELTNPQIETLHTSLAAWTAQSPQHLWRMENTPPTDVIGTSTVKAITGSTVPGSTSPLPIS